MSNIRVILLAILPVVSALTLSAQILYHGQAASNFDLRIENAKHLDPFLSKLAAQQARGGQQISIVHIGDSHIQADFLTAVLRRRLQTHFGDAGRGLIVPLKVAKTNEPRAYSSFSPNAWQIKKCIDLNNGMATGIGGITLRTTDSLAALNFRLHDSWSHNLFSEVAVFAEQGLNAFDLLVYDGDGKNAVTTSSSGTEIRARFEKPSTSVRIQTVKRTPEQQHTTLFGVGVFNGSDGVVYHSIGVNGARYIHFDDSVFTRQTPSLKPDLFILSLGSNEAFRFPNLDRHLKSQINGVISKLRRANPNAVFLLTTPPGGLINKKENEGVVIVRDFVIDAAKENHLAYYDLFAAMGGADSAIKWQHEGLLSSDGIHFTRRGYDLLGDLIFESIMKSYREYVLLRHR